MNFAIIILTPTADSKQWGDEANVKHTSVTVNVLHRHYTKEGKLGIKKNKKKMIVIQIVF